ncbi:hypothetical protein KRMM14A1259_60290 [Krasilnikovia sp. MM14-A1259]
MWAAVPGWQPGSNLAEGPPGHGEGSKDGRPAGRLAPGLRPAGQSTRHGRPSRTRLRGRRHPSRDDPGTAGRGGHHPAVSWTPDHARRDGTVDHACVAGTADHPRPGALERIRGRTGG